ncbi:MAG: M1 family metallopeptidase [Pseudomonadota bacterium]
MNTNTDPQNCLRALLLSVIVPLFTIGASSCERDTVNEPIVNDALVQIETSRSKSSDHEGFNHQEERTSIFDPAQADRLDSFTYANYESVAVTHMDFDLLVDFDAKILSGSTILTLTKKNEAEKELVLDINGLEISGVDVLDEHPSAEPRWKPVGYFVGPSHEPMGAPLKVELPSGAQKVRIAYKTSPLAAGLQWLSPEQTSEDSGPFVYSQAQAINARSIMPLQDTPALRITYSGKLKLNGGSPDALALMAAGQDPDQARDGMFEFNMRQPIPPYLFALAIGDLSFKKISDTIGIYAEKQRIEAAALEFSDAPRMSKIAEELYGPYRWGRYDMLVLPPSFPYGGMENPRLTFLTPTLIAGDGSLVAVIAHEIAHSWSGNLVTNATWRDTWLNEGFTSYVENRIMEELFGEARATMERVLDYQALVAAIDTVDRPELTRLKLPLDLKSPDEGFSRVAYIKGMFFLKFLEQRYGRATFDDFLRDYFDAFAFKAVVTEDFVWFLKQNLMSAHPSRVADDEVIEWVLGEGLPDSLTVPQSDLFSETALQQAEWIKGSIKASELKTRDWSVQEWLYFINSLPGSLSISHYQDLDIAFGLSKSGNAEIAFAWYQKTIRAGYQPSFEPLREFFLLVGRMKFIIPLYEALIDNGRADWAAEVYSAARPGYHPIAQNRLDAILLQ